MFFISPLALATLLIPGLSISGTPACHLAVDCIAFDGPAPAGVEPKRSGLVGVSFEVRTMDGQELVNSDKRGLPYTVSLGGNDLLARLAYGLCAGQVRVAYLSAPSDSAVLPSRADLQVVVRLQEPAQR